MPTPQPSVSTPPTVLVTGAAKRLGREIALTLARAGWRVAVHYRHSEVDAMDTVAACSALSGASAAFCANLADEAAVRALVPQVVQQFGHLDAVVNSASVFEHDTVDGFSFATLNQHLHTNTAAPILLAQALHNHLAGREQLPAGPTQGESAPSEGSDPCNGGARGPGVVVNLLDQKLWNQNPDFFSYTLSKAALEAATTMLALALAPRMRVVGVAPGLTLTSHLLSQDKFEALHRLSPLGRSSTAQDVASAVLFALTNQSLTGTTLLVDGGQHLMRFERDFSLM
ncbi:MAG: SDR family oxidoreductase [Rhodoferax sp.]